MIAETACKLIAWSQIVGWFLVVASVVTWIVLWIRKR